MTYSYSNNRQVQAQRNDKLLFYKKKIEKYRNKRSSIDEYCFIQSKNSENQQNTEKERIGKKKITNYKKFVIFALAFDMFVNHY